MACGRNQDWSEFKLGLGIMDVLKHVYESEQRFQLRDDRPAYLVKKRPGTGLVEAVFGLYPSDTQSSYFARAYGDVFNPTIVEGTPDTWTKVYMDGVVTPLGLTEYRLGRQPTWRDEPKYFVFDPAKPTDLIDLWNLRIEPSRVFPIPIDWWPALVNEVSEHIAAAHRPLQGNPHGVMHQTTVEFARSLDEGRQRSCLDKLDPALSRRSFVWKPWRTSVWHQRRAKGVEPPRPLRVIAQEKTLTLTVGDGDPLLAEFEQLAPDFASLYGDSHARWVNVVNLASFRRDDIATVLPLNVTDSAWPLLDLLHERVVVGTQGWSFPQQFKDSTQTIRLHTQEDAVIASLEHLGVKASLSDAGHIAKQVLQHLGGLRGVNLLADPDTLKFLNSMAGGIRTRNRGQQVVEEIFDRRARSERDWKAHVNERRNRRRLPTFEISQFTDRNVIRLGLSTKCPRCTAANWHGLSTVDYVITCDRCLERYPFPQGALERNNDNWSYRVIGPFSTPDYARGSYGALLALKALKGLSHASECMTYSTALELQLGDGDPCEVDFAAWVSHRSSDRVGHPSLVFGEAKSFGQGDLIRSRDLTQLRRVANRFPGSVISISVMRDEFIEGEVRILLPFVKWARRLNAHWMPTNPVILLTGVELFHEINIRLAWRNRGGRYERFADSDWTRSLHKLAEATQAIHLDLPFFAEDRRAAEQRSRRRLDR